jgi:hypothetical protein
MSFLTADEAKTIRKNVSDALRKVHSKHAGRNRASITGVENENYQIRKSDAEKAISNLHSRSHHSREIRKRVEPAGDNGSAAIAAMHSDRSFAGRTVAGDRTLVAKLANAIGIAIQKDYSSAKQAKAAIQELLETGSSTDVPRNHVTLRSGKGKIGTVAIVRKKGAERPYEIQTDGFFHSSYEDVGEAEECFAALTA